MVQDLGPTVVVVVADDGPLVRVLSLELDDDLRMPKRRCLRVGDIA